MTVRKLLVPIVSGVLGIGMFLVPATAQAAVPAPSIWTPAATLLAGTAIDGLPHEVLTASTPADESVLVVGEDRKLEVSVRPADSAAFPALRTIASDGYFESNNEGSAPDIAVSAAGTVMIAWVGFPADPSSTSPVRQIEVAIRAPGASSWTTQVVSSATEVYDVHLAIGHNGTTAVTWTDGTTVSVAVRAAGTTSWSVVRQVSDTPTPATVIPLVQAIRVAVSSAGAVTVGWSAYDGVFPAGTRIYRLRASTLPGTGQDWSDPSWVSPAGQLIYASTLKAGTDGSVTGAWMSIDNQNPIAIQAATLVAGQWQQPVVLGDHAQQGPELAAGPDGSMTVVWYSRYPGSGTDPDILHIESAHYLPATGWASSVPVRATDSTENLGIPTIAAAADGTLASTWLRYRNQDGWTVQLAHSAGAAGTAWTVPVTVGTIGQSTGATTLSVSPAGWVTVGYDQFHQSGSANVYSVLAAATLRPQLAGTGVGHIAGVPKVGGLLTAGTGSWNPVPSSFTFQWLRNGVGIGGATQSSYRPGIADAATKLNVVVTARLAGYRAGSMLTPGVVVPRPALHNTSPPFIVGSSLVGHMMTAHPGLWSPTATTTGYQWLRNGLPIGGASHSTYRLVAADRAQVVTVRVRAGHAGYLPAAALAAALRPH